MCCMYAVYMLYICCMYAVCMLYVCCMYAVCVLYVCCMYAVCMLYVCCEYAALAAALCDTRLVLQRLRHRLGGVRRLFRHLQPLVQFAVLGVLGAQLRPVRRLSVTASRVGLSVLYSVLSTSRGAAARAL